jgi:hypothetical protein
MNSYLSTNFHLDLARHRRADLETVARRHRLTRFARRAERRRVSRVPGQVISLPTPNVQGLCCAA